MDTKTKVGIAIPTGGFTPSLSMQCLWLWAFHLGKYQADHPEFEFVLFLSQRYHVAANREYMANMALNNSCDYLMFVDDDMVFKPDLFESLYKHKVDVVAALAFTRTPPHLPVIYQLHEGYDPIAKKAYCRTEWIKNYPRRKLIEVDAVGFGAVLIDTKVFKKMTPPYFMCSQESTGEDIYFCINAKRAGARIFCDTATDIGHLGNPPTIDQSTFDLHNDPDMLKKLYQPYTKYGDVEVFMDSDLIKK